MTYTFQNIGEPKFKDFFKLKDKIYFEIVSFMMKFGKTHIPMYFVRGMTEYMRQNIDMFNGSLRGIEIGGAEGENAKTMLSVLPIGYLYLIDPCDFYTESEYGKKGRTSDARGQNEIAEKNLKSFKDKYSYIKDYSFNCVDQFEDEAYDFLYIDGNHDFGCVKQDIELFHPKVKHGGVVGGHDFGGGFFGLMNAVLEFKEEYGYELFTGRDGDWWVVKK